SAREPSLDEPSPAPHRCHRLGDQWPHGGRAVSGLAVPTVEITRIGYGLTDGAEPGWCQVGEAQMTAEAWGGEADAEDYGTPVVWAAARIRDLSCDRNLEPSVYPLPSAVPAHMCLASTYVNPCLTERRETSARVTGVSETDRAEVFRLA